MSHFNQLITTKITIMAEKIIQNADKVAGIIAFLLFFRRVLVIGWVTLLSKTGKIDGFSAMTPWEGHIKAREYLSMRYCISTQAHQGGCTSKARSL